MDKNADLEPLLPVLNQESVLNFPPAHFGVPEQMFAYSSSSDTGLEDDVTVPDIKTRSQMDATSQGKSPSVAEELASTKEISPENPLLNLPKQSTAPTFSSPPNKGTPLRVATFPFNSEVINQANKQVFLIPVNEVDQSKLQSNLKVTPGQNIFIIKSEDLIKSVEEKRLKLKPAAQTPISSQAVKPQQATKTVINQQGIQPLNNHKTIQQISLVQAQQALGSHKNTQANQSVQADNILINNQDNRQTLPAGSSGKYLPNDQVSKSSNMETVNIVFQAQKSAQADLSKQAEPKVDTNQVKAVSVVPAVVPLHNQPISASQVQKNVQETKVEPASLGQEVMQVSQLQLVPREDKSANVTKLVNQAEKNVQTTPSKQINKVLQGMQTNLKKAMNQVGENLKTSRNKPVHKVSQGMQIIQTKETVKGQQGLHRDCSKVVIQVPKTLQENSPKAKKPAQQNLQDNHSKTLRISLLKDETKAQISGNQIQQNKNMLQATSIANHIDQAVSVSTGPVTSLSTEELTRKMQSSLGKAPWKPPSQTPSLWPSTEQTVIPITKEVGVEKPKRGRGRPRKSESKVEEKGKNSAKVTKVDSVKGPTLQTELEKRRPITSTPGRLKNVRPGETQLHSLKHSKVSSSNPWKCSLCGQPSYEKSLGCLYGPYDGSRDLSQAGYHVFGCKRKLDETPEDTAESPAKLKLSIISNSASELWFHGDCIVWSPGIYATGDSLGGYQQAVNDGQLSKCSACGDFGATLVCFQRTCKKLYHFFCAKNAGCNFDESNYTIQCGHHK